MAIPANTKLLRVLHLRDRNINKSKHQIPIDHLVGI